MESYEQKEKIGIVEYISDLFFSPTSLAENIIRKPKVLVPLILNMLLGAAVAITIKDMSIELLAKSFFDSGTFGEMSYEQIHAMMQTQYMTFGIIGATLAPILISLLTAAIYFVLNKIFKGQASFKEIWSLVSFATIIPSVGGLISSFLKVLTGNYWFELSAAAFVQPNDIVNLPKYYGLLQSISPFYLWYYIVLVLALCKLTNLSKSKTIFIVIISVVLGSLLTLGSSLLSSRGA